MPMYGPESATRAMSQPFGLASAFSKTTPLAAAHDSLRQTLQAVSDLGSLLRKSRYTAPGAEQPVVALHAGVAAARMIHHINLWEPLLASAASNLFDVIHPKIQAVDDAVNRSVWSHRMGLRSQYQKPYEADVVQAVVADCWQRLLPVDQWIMASLLADAEHFDAQADSRATGLDMPCVNVLFPHPPAFRTLAALRIQANNSGLRGRTPDAAALKFVSDWDKRRQITHFDPTLSSIPESEEPPALSETEEEAARKQSAGARDRVQPGPELLLSDDTLPPLRTYLQKALSIQQISGGESSLDLCRQPSKAQKAKWVDDLLSEIGNSDEAALQALAHQLRQLTGQIDRQARSVCTWQALEGVLKALLVTAQSHVQRKLATHKSTIGPVVPKPAIERIPALKSLCAMWPLSIRHCLEREDGVTRASDLIQAWEAAPADAQAIVMVTLLNDRKLSTAVRRVLSDFGASTDPDVSAVSTMLRVFCEFLQRKRQEMTDEVAKLYQATGKSRLAAAADALRVGQPRSGTGQQATTPSAQVTISIIDQDLDAFLTGLSSTEGGTNPQEVMQRLQRLGTHQISALIDSAEQRFLEMDSLNRRCPQHPLKVRTSAQERQLQLALRMINSLPKTSYDSLALTDLIAHLTRLGEHYGNSVQGERERDHLPPLLNLSEIIWLCADEHALSLAHCDGDNVRLHLRNNQQLSSSAKAALSDTAHLTVWQNGHVNMARFNEMFGCLPALGNKLQCVFYQALARRWHETPATFASEKRKAMTQALRRELVPPELALIESTVASCASDAAFDEGTLRRRLRAMVLLTGSRLQGVIQMSDKRLVLGQLKHSPANAMAFLLTDMALNALAPNKPTEDGQ